MLSPLGRGLTLWAFWCNLLHLSHPSTLEHFHSLAIFGFIGFLQRHGNFHFFFLGDLGSMPHFHSLLHGGILSSSSLNMSPSLTLSLWAPRGSLTPQAGAMPPPLYPSLKNKERAKFALRRGKSLFAGGGNLARFARPQHAPLSLSVAERVCALPASVRLKSSSPMSRPTKMLSFCLFGDLLVEVATPVAIGDGARLPGIEGEEIRLLPEI